VSLSYSLTLGDPVDDVHRRYYDSKVWLHDTRWLGVPVQKMPTDLWVYAELIHDLRPELIIETGSYNGGSALFLASMCDLVDRGRVISIDLDPQPDLPTHDRLEFVTASSTDPSVVARMADEPADTVLVILDSDHTASHVYAELDAYAPLVTAGSYLIVEDGNINGHPVLPGWGPGPTEALAEWLPDHPEFTPDRHCERFLLTQNPNGYLRRR